MSELIERLRERQRARIKALRQAIDEKGISGAIEFADLRLRESREASSQAKIDRACAVICIYPENSDEWKWGADIDHLLRQQVSNLLLEGRELPPELGLFATWAIMRAPVSKAKGRPSDKWKQLKLIPISHPDCIGFCRRQLGHRRSCC
ncbi:MAG: hypothetical protein RL145_1247 [Pseudomonadota bacterium]